MRQESIKTAPNKRAALHLNVQEGRENPATARDKKGTGIASTIWTNGSWRKGHACSGSAVLAFVAVISALIYTLWFSCTSICIRKHLWWGIRQTLWERSVTKMLGRFILYSDKIPHIKPLCSLIFEYVSRLWRLVSLGSYTEKNYGHWNTRKMYVSIFAINGFFSENDGRLKIE